MEDFADDAVRTIVLKCSAQSAKTETAMALLMWVLCEAPGPLLWLTADIDAAKLFAKDRLNPTIDLCAPLKGKIPTSRTQRVTLAIYIMGCVVNISGAKSKSSLDSTPYRYLFLDEARTYDKGVLQRVDKRTRSFTHNYRKFIFSTPASSGDEFDCAYEGGNQNEWHIECPDSTCKHRQTIAFKLKHDEKGGIGWIEDETTVFPDGKLDYTKILPSTYWECRACGHRVTGRAIDSHSQWRKSVSRDGDWVPQNPNAPAEYRSYTWNAFIPFWPDWRKSVHEYLEARQAAQWGNWELLKEFYQQTLGMSWSDRMMTLGEEEELLARQGDYAPEAVAAAPEWVRGTPCNDLRFLTADVQGKGGRHFWVCVRHWWRGGKSKLLHYTKAHSYEEIADIAKQWQVPAPCVIFDSGYAATEIYAQVLQSGRRWKAYKGEDKDAFLVDGMHVVCKHSSADPAIGTAMAGRTFIDLWLYAKYGCLDRLAMLMKGQAGDWQFHQGAGDEYLAQMTAYDKLPATEIKTKGKLNTKSRKMVWHRRHDNDHATSCELMQVAAAAMAGLTIDTAPQTTPHASTPNPQTAT